MAMGEIIFQPKDHPIYQSLARSISWYFWMSMGMGSTTQLLHANTAKRWGRNSGRIFQPVITTVAPAFPTRTGIQKSTSGMIQELINIKSPEPGRPDRKS